VAVALTFDDDHGAERILRAIDDESRARTPCCGRTPSC
jgi:hypothetical protein